MVVAPLALGIAMVAIDATIVSVANPTIGRDLHASLGGLQWVTNGYLLALCALLLTAGRFADRVGRKRVFIAGVGWFGLASAGCALAGSTVALISFRVLQGVGGAMLMPASVAVLRAQFSGEDLDRAIGAWGAASASSLAAGPVIGGFLVQHISWQSVFLINVPIAAVVMAGTAVLAGESRADDPGGGYDLPGIALAGAGLFLLVFALVKVPSHGWGSAYTLCLLAAGLVTLAAFVMRERAAPSPMLSLSLFRSSSLTAAAALITIAYLALYGVLFFCTLYLQRVLGESAGASGLQLGALTIAIVVFAPAAAWLSGRAGPRPTALIAFLALAVGVGLLTRAEIADRYGGVWPSFVLLGAGFAFMMISCFQSLLSNAPVQFAGTASALLSIATQLGGVLGIGLLGSVLASRATSTLRHELAAYHLPPRLASSLAHATSTSSSTSLPGGLASHLPSAAVRHLGGAADTAFVNGLHTAMWVAAAVALGACALVPLIRRGEGDAHAAFAV
jgi:EmrB/QacA subfamily drug resistance transporter